MKHRFYGVFEQERESKGESWDEAYDPELYEIYESPVEANKAKSELTKANHNPLVRYIVIKIDPIDMILDTPIRSNNRGMGGDYL